MDDVFTKTQFSEGALVKRYVQRLTIKINPDRSNSINGRPEKSRKYSERSFHVYIGLPSSAEEVSKGMAERRVAKYETRRHVPHKTGKPRPR